MNTLNGFRRWLAESRRNQLLTGGIALSLGGAVAAAAVVLAVSGDGDGRPAIVALTATPTPQATRPRSTATPTPAPAPTASPTPEPAVQRIAYIGADRDVWIINADGSDNRKLFDVPTGEGDSVHNLQWAPDGSKFTVTMSPKDVIYIVSAEGDKLLEVPAVTFLAWSPTGDSFAVARPPALQVEPALILLDLQGQPLIEAINDVQPLAPAFSPSFSSDGHHLAFLQDLGGDGLCGILRGFVADLQTGQVSPVDAEEEPIGCGNGAPLFSPTVPSLLAYGKQLYDLANGQKLPLPGNAVRWSADGRRVVVCVRETGRQAILYDINAAAPVLELPYTPAPDGPCWMHLIGWGGSSPDGELFAVYDRASGDLRIRGVSSPADATVPVSSGGTQSVQFSPDGRHVLLEQSTKVPVVDVEGAVVSLTISGTEAAWQPQP